MRGMWWDFAFTRDVCQWARAVLPNTSAEGDLIHEAFDVPREHIHVIPNGVSENFLHGDPELFRQKYGVDKFILNVGHVGPDRKNVLGLVKALETIDHPAVIIGRITPGGQADEIMRLAEKNKNLLIIDGIDHDSPLLASAYAACDVFAMPSKFETPGIAALEAALGGAKVVITPHGGTRDYFEDRAIYVDPYSVEDIRQGIEAALNRPADDDLKQHVVDNFLWRRVAELTLEAYRSVLENG